jgi:hypothetical protein
MLATFSLACLWVFISCFLSRTSGYILQMCINNIREDNYIRKLSQHKEILFRYTMLPAVSAISAMVLVPKLVRSDSATGNRIIPSDESPVTTSFLGRRVSSSDSDNYRPGLEDVDIFYPPWYVCVYTVHSKLNIYIRSATM